MNSSTHDAETLRLENAELRARLAEAEDTLAAIRSGDVDALIVGEDIYTLDSANAATQRMRKDVLAQMEDAVLAFDDGEHLIFMNPAAERQYGHSASDMLGRQRAEVYTEVWPDSARRASAQQELSTHGAYRAHSVHVRLDGHAMHVEATVSRLRDAEGRPLGTLAVIRDISERIRVEQTLQVATAELTRRERQFSTLVENSPDIFARFDADLRHRYVSPVVLRYTGMEPAQFIGRTNAELGMPPALCVPWAAGLHNVFETGAIERMKFDIVTPEGERRVFESRLIPEFATDGSVESVLSIASDVTEQEAANNALRESQARLQFTLDAARVGDWEIDLSTDIAHHSLRHDRCFGYDEPVHPWSLPIFLAHVHPDDRAGVEREMRSSAEHSTECHFECRVLWRDGSTHWIEVHGSVHGGHGNTPRRMLGIVFEITERKQAESVLREADRRKDEFLATLAHELRNPLAPIRNALQIMQLTPEPAVHDKARSIIERQLKQMVHLVDDLLDVSRISQNKVELRREQVDINSVVQTAVETSRPLIDASRHQLTMRLPPPRTLVVDADVTRLCQILANLLNNAAKYTPEGGRIEVAAEKDGSNAVITVQDSGVGILPEQLPRVFDMFAQVDRSLDRAQGGLGIGLALVKRLVEMHGGTVHATSAGRGRGCCFVVRLPLAQATPQAPAMPQLPPPRADATAAVRVLVIDDNIDSADSLSELLSVLGYETQVGHDGLEAVRAAEAWRPQVALLDIGLPGITGLEAAERIRAHDWGRQMLLVALSGWGQDEDRRKSKAAGFDHHLVKPVDFDLLAALLAPVTGS